MKKMLIPIIFAIILVGFMAFAYAEDNSTNDNISSAIVTFDNTQNITINNQNFSVLNRTIEVHSTISNQTRENEQEVGNEIKEIITKRNQIRKEIKNELKNGNNFTYTTKNGTNITFSKWNGKINIMTKTVPVITELNISEDEDCNGTILSVGLNNGQNRTIKIMPDTAAERALERLSIKVCNTTSNCSIELKDVGKRNMSKIVYELKAVKKSKIFGLFNKKMRVESQVDSDSGNVTTRKPWWAFLAKEEN